MACPIPRREFLSKLGVGAALWAVSGRSAAPGSEVEPRGRPDRGCRLKLGLASYSLRKFSLEDALSMTRRVGLEHLCLKSFHLPLDSSAEEIAEARGAVEDAGIRLYAGGVISLRDRDEATRAFEYAKAAGMETIVGAPFPSVLPLIDELAKRHDIRVAIHNHGPGDKNYPTPGSAYEKIRALDRRIGLCIDVGHTTRIGDDPVAAAERYADRLLDVHIKDVSEAKPSGKEVEVGRGVIDIPGILEVLCKVRFSGVVAFEYEKDPEDPLAGLAESVGYVRGVLSTL